MTTDPEELDDTERTTEELAEILAQGGAVDVYLDHRLRVAVTLADVVVSVDYRLDAQAVTDLASGLADNTLRLALDNHDLNAPIEVDGGELALLGRVMDARARLITPPDTTQEHPA